MIYTEGCGKRFWLLRTWMPNLYYLARYRHKKIAFIVGYRVGDASVSLAGPSTAFMQQYHRQFILDLQSRLEYLIQDNNYIVLALDNNEELIQESGIFKPLQYSPGKRMINHQHDDSLAKLMKICCLVNISTTQHTHQPPPATFNREKWR